MATDLIFIDTSLLVAAVVDVHPSHGMAAAYLARIAVEGKAACVSGQVCREFLFAVTRNSVEGRAFTMNEALAVLDKARESLVVLEEDGVVLRAFLDLVRHLGVPTNELHDANIVATMRANGVRKLVTLNAADFERYEGLIQLEPLVS